MFAPPDTFLAVLTLFTQAITRKIQGIPNPIVSAIWLINLGEA